MSRIEQIAAFFRAHGVPFSIGDEQRTGEHIVVFRGFLPQNENEEEEEEE